MYGYYEFFISRYMEWYTKNKPGPDKQDKSDRRKSDAALDGEKITKPVVESRLFKETVSSSNKKVDSSKKTSVGPDHPLLQHSEHRYLSIKVYKIFTFEGRWIITYLIF